MTRLIFVIPLFVLAQCSGSMPKSDNASTDLLFSIITNEKELKSIAPDYQKFYGGEIMAIQVENNLMDTIIIPYSKIWGVKWYSPETVGYLSLSANKDTIVGESRLTVTSFAVGRDTLLPGKTGQYFIPDHYWTEEDHNLQFAQFGFPVFMTNGITNTFEFLTNLDRNKDSLRIIRFGEMKKGEKIDIGIGYNVTLY